MGIIAMNSNPLSTDAFNCPIDTKSKFELLRQEVMRFLHAIYRVSESVQELLDFCAKNKEEDKLVAGFKNKEENKYKPV